MVIGGLQKSSFIDYPGKIACVLFLSGCNFNCPYCHNPELARGSLVSVFSKEKNLYDFLERRKGILDGVVISGGEPTLQEDLFPLCKKIKQMGYSVKLDTNGSRPQVVQRLIDEGLIDYVAMDIKTDPIFYSPLIQKDCDSDQIVSSIKIIMESTIAYEFKTTCVKPIVDATVIESISRLIKGAMLYVLQRFHGTKVLHPEFFQKNSFIYFVYSNDELMHLKSLAEPWVKRCIIR